MKIFVGNLVFSAVAADVRTLFEGFGSVAMVEIVLDKKGRKSRGFGFVEMSDDAEANSAIAALNNKEFMGRPLNVSPSKPKKQLREEIAKGEHNTSQSSAAPRKYDQEKRNHVRPRRDSDFGSKEGRPPSYRSDRGDGRRSQGPSKPWKKSGEQSGPWKKPKGDYRPWKKSDSASKPWQKSDSETKPWQKNQEGFKPWQKARGESKPWKKMDGELNALQKPGARIRSWKKTTSESKPWEKKGPGEYQPSQKSGVGTESKPWKKPKGDYRPWKKSGKTSKPWKKSVGQSKPWQKFGNESKPHGSSKNSF